MLKPKLTTSPASGATQRRSAGSTLPEPVYSQAMPNSAAIYVKPISKVPQAMNMKRADSTAHRMWRVSCQRSMHRPASSTGSSVLWASAP